MSCTDNGNCCRITLIVLFLLCLLQAQTTTQLERLVDSHTAGVLSKGIVKFETRIYPSADSLNSGCLFSIAAGISNRLNIGISYGGEGIIGRGDHLRLNPYPGGYFKYRIFEENFIMPGIVLGYEHQGFGGLSQHQEQYLYKSQGFFLGVSKNYLFLNTVQFGMHGALNYSMQDKEQISWPNALVGVDLGFNEELSLIAEYDLGLNVKDPARKGEHSLYGRPQDGFLNLGIRWAFSPNFYFEFDVRDILEKREINGKKSGWSREIKLLYAASL